MHFGPRLRNALAQQPPRGALCERTIRGEKS
jgi:hypothetical protein